MACPQCAVNPRSHSFVNFGRMRDGVKLWYSAPGRAEETIDNPAKFAHFKKHLDSARGSPWIWIVDFNGIGKDNQTPFNIHLEMVTTLINEHSTVLKDVWIINPNVWFKTAILLIKPFLTISSLQNIQYFDSIDTYFLHEIRDARLTSLPWRASA